MIAANWKSGITKLNEEDFHLKLWMLVYCIHDPTNTYFGTFIC